LLALALSAVCFVGNAKLLLKDVEFRGESCETLFMKRPIIFKLDAYRFYCEGCSPLEAFAKAGQVHDVPLSGCMTTKAWASSYMSDDIRNWLRKQIAKGNSEVAEYFEKYQLR
jgi:hypothetical protein